MIQYSIAVVSTLCYGMKYPDTRAKNSRYANIKYPIREKNIPL